MTRFLIAIALIAGASSFWLGTAEPPAKDDAKAKDAVKEVVVGLFKNWETGQATKSAEAFQTDEMPVARVFHRQPKPTSKQMTAGEFLKDCEKNAPQHLKVESTEVDLMDAGYAVARVKYVGGGVRGRAVATLVNDGKEWRIVSLSLHEFFNW